MAAYYAAVAITNGEVSGFVRCSESTLHHWVTTLPEPYSSTDNPAELWYYIEVNENEL